MKRLTNLPEWRALASHHSQIQKQHLREMFVIDPKRAEKFSLGIENIFLDYSKHRINEETLSLLLNLVKSLDIEDWRDRMLQGEKINFTENRAVLHTALRKRDYSPLYVDGIDVMPNVRRVLDRMREITENVQKQRWLGYTGEPIQDVVNIGIGGSDLGPFMVCHALTPYATPKIKTHFVSNVDGADLAQTLKQCNPQTTLFIIASKTFTTQETMTNARSAKQWFLKTAIAETAIAKHFIAISTNKEEVRAFGIDLNNMLEFWDWVGGRYSLWSAIGISIALNIGMDNFEQLLAGAYAMDQHFQHSPLASNMPVIMAVLGIWYNNFFSAQTHAILPYDQGLSHFVAYMQQCDMESNGKSVDHGQQHISDYSTGPIVWGAVGTNGQHAFYQLIHQGNKFIPCDFIVPAKCQYALNGLDEDDHHPILVANAFAQARAMMQGKTLSEVEQELREKALTIDEIQKLSPHMVLAGNVPSSTLLIDKITPYSLGQLIALYEHKIFVQGVVWQINSFDQWGVEIGKQIAKQILPQLSSPQETHFFDSSTDALINQFKKRTRLS